MHTVVDKRLVTSHSLSQKPAFKSRKGTCLINALKCKYIQSINVLKWAYIELAKPSRAFEQGQLYIFTNHVHIHMLCTLTRTHAHMCTGKNQLSSWTWKPRLEQIHIINRVKSLCSRWNPRRLARHFVRDYAIPSRQNWQSLAVRPLHQILAPMSNHIVLWRQDWPK